MKDESLRCDFCFAPNPEFTERCFSFAVPFTYPPVYSKGDWKACAGCHEFVITNNRGALLQYVISVYWERYRDAMPEVMPVLESMTKQLHEAFWKHHIAESN